MGFYERGNELSGFMQAGNYSPAEQLSASEELYIMDLLNNTSMVAVGTFEMDVTLA